MRAIHATSTKAVNKDLSKASSSLLPPIKRGISEVAGLSISATSRNSPLGAFRGVCVLWKERGWISELTSTIRSVRRSKDLADATKHADRVGQDRRLRCAASVAWLGTVFLVPAYQDDTGHGMPAC